MPTSRSLTTFAGILAVAMTSTLAEFASAQSSASPEGRWHRVDSDNAFVRSDASATVAYPVGRVPRDTMVLVVEDRFGWAKVRPTGEAFDSLHAFVVADHATVVEGETVRVDVRTPLKAANFAAREDPARSWKEVARLEPGATLEFVETIESDGRGFHKVRMPETAEAWINLSFLKPATAEEVAALVAETSKASDGIPTPPGSLELITPAPAVVSAHRETVPGRAAASDGESVDEAVGIEVLVASESPAPAASASLDDLESAWATFQAKEQDERALGDYAELRDRYLVLASASDSSAATRHRAKLRAEQILLQTEIQSRLLELRRMQEQNLMDLQAIREIREVMESRGDFDAVGRLNASLVYDGRRLPLLYRLQEPGEGATVAYLVPTRDFSLAELTGQLVGVSGDLRYDEALRLNIITPRRVDILVETSP
ncbi:MAG: hypothetical protein ACO4BU_07830 [Phycisphaerales bacterium]|jgi:hypothetical protein